MSRELRIFVPGTPVAKGSTHAFVNKGKAITVQTNAKKQKPWASLIALTAQQGWTGGLYEGPVRVTLCFRFTRPKSHFRTGKFAAMPKPGAPVCKLSVPDLDKLTRCVLDALTGVVWVDDKQVVGCQASKGYEHLRPGVHIIVERFDDAAEWKGAASE